MKIVILDGHTANPGDLSWDGFKALGELTVYDRTPDAEIPFRIGSAEAVLVNKAPITRTVLEACPSIRYIGVLATGYNIVDTAAAGERGIPVCNIPDYSTAAVAQLVFALLLEICHHPGAHSDAVHAGRWTRSRDFAFWDYPLTELAGKTLGIIGFGRIGQTVAVLGRAFGMKVLACSRSRREAGENLAAYVTLEKLLAESDVVSLHCPLSEDTQGLINQKTIALMKNGAILINPARGPVIVEEEVAAALNSGKLSAAGVDVVSAEPIRADNPLLSAKNCIITPHIGWAPLECRARLINIAEENLRAFIAGAPVNVVNL
ncbi:MAG: D-2-hydroxyacid dehydrogenase [Spirochaetaceae bacterium]|jgi:glycerate dehydrogenase|nr:D-2-hydroxyacid dehydrogenase [Spirochaetaceae bacterium]